MINEERVKELCHMAVFDEHSAGQCRQMGEYYMWDYVGKELVKSFFTGTIAYLLLLLLWGMYNSRMLIDMLNGPDLKALVGWGLLLYVVFLVVYLVLTAIIYCVRYVYGRKKLRRYAEHLKKVRKMYNREDRMNR